MDLNQRCANIKEQVAADLLAANDALARGDVLIQALYELDRTVLPALGQPKKTEEYLQQQATVVDLVTFIAIPMIRGAEQDRRGVAVLSEVGEACLDPLLKKKLTVYAQELLTRSQPEKNAPPVISFPRIFFIVGIVSLIVPLVYYTWPVLNGSAQPAGVVIEVDAPPENSGSPANHASLIPTSGLPSVDGVVSREKGEDAKQAEKTGEEGKQAPAGELVTRVRVVNNQVLVPVTLKNSGESVRVELLLDTGATRTAVHEGLAGRLRIDLRGAKVSQSELADGRVVNSRVGRIDSLSVGPFAMPSAEVELIPYKGAEGVHDGLLGMDFLGKHRYQIDIEHETIRWF